MVSGPWLGTYPPYSGQKLHVYAPNSIHPCPCCCVVCGYMHDPQLQWPHLGGPELFFTEQCCLLLVSLSRPHSISPIDLLICWEGWMGIEVVLNYYLIFMPLAPSRYTLPLTAWGYVLIQPFCKTTRFMSSFEPLTISVWNTLDNKIVNCPNITSLKSLLCQNF